LAFPCVVNLTSSSYIPFYKGQIKTKRKGAPCPVNRNGFLWGSALDYPTLGGPLLPHQELMNCTAACRSRCADSSRGASEVPRHPKNYLTIIWHHAGTSNGTKWITWHHPVTNLAPSCHQLGTSDTNIELYIMPNNENHLARGARWCHCG